MLDKSFPELPKAPAGYYWVTRGCGWSAESARYVYLSKHGDCWIGMNSVLEKVKANGFPEYYYVELVENSTVLDPTNIQSQINYAKSLIGETVCGYGRITFNVKDWGIARKGGDGKSWLVMEEVNKNDYCVYVEGGGFAWPVSIASVVKKTIVEVKLNKAYTAKVSDSEIEVGCQKFETSVLEDLIDAAKKAGYKFKNV